MKLKFNFFLQCKDKIVDLIINNKLLVLATEKSDIFIKNIYTDEVY